MALVNPFTSVAKLKYYASAAVASIPNAFLGSNKVDGISNPVAKSAVNFVANHPLATAGIATLAISPAGRSLVTKAVSSLSTKTKVAVGVSAIIAAPALIQSPKLTSKVIDSASAIADVPKLSGALGSLYENPSVNKAKEIITQYKDTLLVGGALAAVGAIATGGIGTAATLLNTYSVNKNTKATTSANKPKKETPALPTAELPKVDTGKVTIPTASVAPVSPTNPVPNNPITAPITSSGKVSGTSTKRRKRRYSKPKGLNKVNLNLKIHASNYSGNRRCC